ncbi:MAG: ATP-binding cassette domain-containing protein [Candidatus Thorarchaeota archaeon]|nr:ATP-binding cassette domain-containing protein [Candidatus Thorarchaeota archaeon]
MTESREKPKMDEDHTAVEPEWFSDPQVQTNPVFAFLGPNGAGKKTRIKLFLGLARPTSCDGAILAHELTIENKRILV